VPIDELKISLPLRNSVFKNLYFFRPQIANDLRMLVAHHEVQKNLRGVGAKCSFWRLSDRLGRLGWDETRNGEKKAEKRTHGFPHFL